MAQQTINLGTPPAGLNGDDARTAFTKTNENFTELYGVTTNPKISAIAASVWAANQLMYTTGASAVAMTALTAAARALLDDADSPAMRVTLGLGGQSLQALNALAGVANGVPFFNSSTTMQTAASTAYGRGLWNLADAAAGRTALALGTAATRDLTISTTDTTTPGAVLKVGDFGLGQLAAVLITPATLDLVSLATGMYRFTVDSGGFKGLPAGTYSAWINRLNTATSTLQLVIDFTNGRTFSRGSTTEDFVQRDSIGVGQGWSDMTASRALGTTYTNTTGRPIQIAGVAGPASGAVVTMIVTIGSLPIYGNYSGSVGNFVAFPMAIIPPGSTYTVAAANGTAALVNWRELR